MKLLVMQFSPISRHVIFLPSKYSPQHPVLKHPQSMILNVRDQVSRPYGYSIYVSVCNIDLNVDMIS
jgi:hypothetical protein